MKKPCSLAPSPLSSPILHEALFYGSPALFCLKGLAPAVPTTLSATLHLPSDLSSAVASPGWLSDLHSQALVEPSVFAFHHLTGQFVPDSCLPSHWSVTSPWPVLRRTNEQCWITPSIKMVKALSFLTPSLNHNLSQKAEIQIF